jgi:START domain
LDEIQGVLRVKASLSALMALLKDAPFNRHWVYRSGGARVLQESGYAQAYVYGVVDAPFPISDRDSVVRFDYRQDPVSKAITITITNVPDFVPPEPQLVRVPDIGGHWALQPLAEGWVEVTYQIHGDPGGWIPVWLVNRSAQVSVKNTLQNLVVVVGRYEGVRSEFVLEPDHPAL